ncbi:DUF2510 domain-containing protein [Catellatospora chokoriensis]|uniref:DUF2510 domain-containing protein n=1 Tax=Catellatospora chokoriensis TaxID=310353 RepID=A0A8J3NSG1_9ACTN|nr:DUF2510 domain-containing protein [Catellatospora chokoriensis]GIF91015.1 hypothetical protein Cch02nite_44590 [Catellatospora chokoriensis]
MPLTPPAGWYAGADDYVRYWTGQRWSDHLVPSGRAVPPPVPANRIATGMPRARWARTARAVLLLISALGPAALVADVALRLLPATASPDDLARWLVLSLLAVPLGWVAPQVGYRVRDVLFLLVPGYAVLWACRVVWRYSYLPFADWLPREQDAMNWRQVPHPVHAGELLFVPARRD